MIRLLNKIFKIGRPITIVLLRLPKEMIDLPVIELCPYDGILKHNCKGCKNYVGTNFCNY